MHIADLHIGKTLANQRRYAEFEQLCAWLIDTIRRESIDCLLIAGDVFDSATPSNKAQELYYSFLGGVAGATQCRDIVVIGGNHDSPTLLQAPQALLRRLGIHVVAEAAESATDEVITLEDAAGTLKAIICAVPYLRDRDVRFSEPHMSLEGKSAQLSQGIAQHYQEVTQYAAELKSHAGTVPCIVMGHLFIAGGEALAGDGVRDLYVGDIAHMGAHIFPEWVDYVALGHLHIAHAVAGRDNVRYSGSLIPLGFHEAKNTQSVCIIDYHEGKTEVRTVAIPRFRAIHTVTGTLEQIYTQLEEVATAAAAGGEFLPWVSVEYTGEEIVPQLRQKLSDYVADFPLEIIQVKDQRRAQAVLAQLPHGKTLADVTPTQVFTQFLHRHNVPEIEVEPLLQAYGQIVHQVEMEDSNAG